jgi:hypothetical protein
LYEAREGGGRKGCHEHEQFSIILHLKEISRNSWKDIFVATLRERTANSVVHHNDQLIILRQNPKVPDWKLKSTLA